MKVICIDDTGGGLPRIRSGAVYEVSAVSGSFLTLAGTHGAWFVDRFTAAGERKTDIGALRSLLAENMEPVA